ncbi:MULTISPECIES: lycopene beta-cyclase CrtY [Rhodomicrobium]|uniref:lycopene beta-cyclase CrtY n=1 Tax=Rhodomicrobium TaxID=1068 RepID=UPI000B4A69C8|nr:MULTISPECIES: lycopene beta-cyclase CrtY [Rhodomicrobium]
MTDHDVIFAGGGLASTLAACRLKALRPELRLLVIEGGAQLGGNHTWSCHASDLTPAQASWIAPFITYRWPGQVVRFPKYTRRLDAGYQSISSTTLHHVALAALGGGCIRLNARIAALEPSAVLLDGGERLTAPCIIDGRGPAPSAALALGFQKFIGLELRLAAPHGETVPVIMDAAISQDDGYRFVYTLPFTADTILIEDTYYADGPSLEPAAIRRKIEAYAAARGWRIAQILREETGTLPILLGGDIDAFWREVGTDVARIGLRACLFHPTTGYSLPDAVATADAIAALPELTTASVASLTQALSKRLWQQRGFYRMLNRFLFLAAEPGKRYEIMQRFYSLAEPLIERFYRAASSPADKARILIGRPPVPIARALAHIREASLRPSQFGDAGQSNG